MKIYCNTQSKIDLRLEPFIGTDIWVLGTFPQTSSGIDCYVNLVSKDNETITYNRISVPSSFMDREHLIEKRQSIWFRDLLNSTLGNRPITVPCDQFNFVPIEPLSITTTDELIALIGGDE